MGYKSVGTALILLTSLLSASVYAENEQEFVSAFEEPRELHALTWNTILYDKKYTPFWTWYIGWWKLMSESDSNRLDFAKPPCDKQLALQVVQRKACTDTRLMKFSFDIECSWGDIWDLWAQYQWDFKREYKIGWKSQQSYCNQGYYPDSKSKCVPCPIGCFECINDQKCLSCYKNFTYVVGEDFGYCVPQCPKGKYLKEYYDGDMIDLQYYIKKTNTKLTPTMAVSQCTACAVGCEDCVYDNDEERSYCYQCKPGFSFNYEKGKCSIAQCDSGTYRPSELKSKGSISNSSSDYYSCKDCPKNCKNCSTDGVSCQTCKSDYSLNKGQCLQCPAFCQSCAYNNATKVTYCEKCQQSFTLQNNGAQCTLNRTCASGYWFNDSILGCSVCPENCVSCKQGDKNGTVACLNCTYEYKVDNYTKKCVDKCSRFKEYQDFKTGLCVSCKNTTYPDQANQVCQSCSKNCDSCSVGYVDNNDDHNSDDKSDCKAYGKVIVEDCSKCAIGTTYDSSWRRCKTACNSTATFNFTRMECVDCKSNQFVNLTTQTCNQCPNNCTNCKAYPGGKRAECSTCKTGFVVDSTEKLCRPNCTNASHYFEQKNYTCRSCPNATLINSTTRVCDKCPTGCNTCANNKLSSKIECSTCQSGYVMDATRKLCRPTCASWKTFYWETYSCRECPPYSTYSYNTTRCEKCAFGCIDCFSQYKANVVPTCISCDNSTLYDSKTFQCKLPCNLTTIFNYQTNTCESCPSGQYLDPTWNKCQACANKNCSSCEYNANTYSTTCKKCNDLFILDSTGICQAGCTGNTYFDKTKNSCVACPVSTYLDSVNQICKGCPQNCTTCSNSIGKVTCSGCSSGFILDSDQISCRESCTSTKPYFNTTTKSCGLCPAKTYYSAASKVCTDCPANCTDCKEDIYTGKVSCGGCLNSNLLDDVMLQCKPSCPANSQYDWSLKRCSQCTAGTWLNSTVQKCQACPSNCMSCNYISTSKTYQCQSCYAGYVLEASNKLCRPNCSSSQYFSWTSNSCVSCPAGQYLDSVTTTCKACASNCASCAQNLDTKAVECIVCKSGYDYDTQRKSCKLPCAAPTYYDWDAAACKSCPETTFLNVDYQQCQSCPSGCLTCGMDSISKEIDCFTCSAGQIFDSVQKLCRPSCNATAYFDWTYFGCIDCKSTQYLDTASNTCNACPANCTSCFKNAQTSTVECSSCITGNIIDNKLKTCRQTCDSATQFYDYTSNSCVTCRIGTWLNPTTQTCDSCSIGCYKCAQYGVDNTVSQCTECLPNLVYERSVCRKNCAASNQFYDWSIEDCKNCTYPCVQCSVSSTTCTLCDEMYNTQTSDGSCTLKCVAGKEKWNTVTKTCDTINLRVFNVTFTAASYKTIRCRSTSITAKVAGQNTTETPKYSWSYSLLSGGVKNQADWSSALNTVISQANTNQVLTLSIPITLTEKFQESTQITVSMSMTVGSYATVANSTLLLIEPFVYTTIGNYSLTYSIYASDGLPLMPAFYYPECPIVKGPEAIPSTISIGCNLYDVNSNLIKALPQCQIKANELSPALTYYIKYYYLPSSYQTALRDTIKVTTIAQVPSCSIANANMIYVKSTDTLTLKVAVVNARTGFKYTWLCNPQTSGATCGVLSSTQNTADMSLPASTLTQNALYNFTLNIFENTAFQTTCSALVEVVSTSPLALSVTLMDNANSRNYIDPTLNQNMMCQQSQETKASLDYEWSVLRISDNLIIFSSAATQFATNPIQSSANALSVIKNTLAQGDYEVSCTAQNIKYKGTVSKIYTTSLVFVAPIEMNVSPTTGSAQQTDFTITLKKPSGYQLICEFGYVTASGDVKIYDSQTQTYNSQMLRLVTKLDQMSSTDMQTLYANCYDTTKAYARTTFQVTVIPSTTLIQKFISKLDTALRGVQIQTELQMQVQLSDIEDTFKQIQIGSADNVMTLISQMMLQVQQMSSEMSDSETVVVLKMVEELVAMLENSENTEESKKAKQDTEDALILILAPISGVTTTLDMDSYFQTVDLIVRLSKSTNQTSLMTKVQTSIEQGALRVSGNMLPNSQPLYLNNKFFAMKLTKVSKEAFSKAGALTSALHRNNETLNINIPYNTLFNSFTTLITLERMWKTQEKSLLSNKFDIDIYSAKDPISYNGQVDIQKIVVQNIQTPITMMVPIEQGTSAKGSCSYFNENTQKWSKLVCPATNTVQDLSQDMMNCCTDHLTSFAIVDDQYFIELAQKEKYQFTISMIPSILVAVFLLASISVSLIKKTKSASQSEQESVSFDQNVAASKVQDQTIQVTGEDSSPTKMRSPTSPVGESFDVSNNQINSKISQAKIIEAFNSNNAGIELVSSKLLIANIMLFCFTVSTLLVSKIDSFTSLTSMTYLCVLISEVLLTCISKQLNKSTFLSAFWLLAMLSMIIAQPILITLRAPQINAFTAWFSASFAVLILSMIVQDMMIIPIYHKLMTRIRASKKE